MYLGKHKKAFYALDPGVEPELAGKVKMRVQGELGKKVAVAQPQAVAQATAQPVKAVQEPAQAPVGGEESVFFEDYVPDAWVEEKAQAEV